MNHKKFFRNKENERNFFRKLIILLLRGSFQINFSLIHYTNNAKAFRLHFYWWIKERVKTFFNVDFTIENMFFVEKNKSFTLKRITFITSQNVGVAQSFGKSKKLRKTNIPKRINTGESSKVHNAKWNFNRKFFARIEPGIVVFKIQRSLYGTGVGVILF